MNDYLSTLDFENIWHDGSQTLVLEVTDTISNATTTEVSNGPTPDDLADGTWMG